MDSQSSQSSSKSSTQPIDRFKLLYMNVNEDETPLPRSWSSQDKCNTIGLTQNNLRVHYKGDGKMLLIVFPEISYETINKPWLLTMFRHLPTRSIFFASLCVVFSHENARVFFCVCLCDKANFHIKKLSA